MMSDPPATNELLTESVTTIDNIESSSSQQDDDPQPINNTPTITAPPPQETRYPYWLLNDNTPPTPAISAGDRQISATARTSSPSSPSSFLSNMSDVIYPNQRSQSDG